MDANYHLKKIINMNLDDAILYFSNLKDTTNQEKGEYLTLKATFSSELSEYNKDTKIQINTIVEDLKLKYKDYRGAILKDSTKKGLPISVIRICDRELEWLSNVESVFPEIEKEILIKTNKKLLKNSSQKLINDIYSQKDEYIKSFETIKEGIRAWDCLIACIESGTVTVENIEEYGINIE